MNKRIEQLALQAGLSISDNLIWCSAAVDEDRTIRKFARAIILECLDVLDKQVPARIGMHAMNAITEHFGPDDERTN